MEESILIFLLRICLSIAIMVITAPRMSAALSCIDIVIIGFPRYRHQRALRITRMEISMRAIYQADFKAFK